MHPVFVLPVADKLQMTESIIAAEKQTVLDFYPPIVFYSTGIITFVFIITITITVFLIPIFSLHKEFFNKEYACSNNDNLVLISASSLFIVSKHGLR